MKFLNRILTGKHPSRPRMTEDRKHALDRQAGQRSWGKWYFFALAAVAALSLMTYWPMLDAYYFLDDFAFITLSRYTDQPLLYYVTSHFPGSLFYRPTGMLLWWLTVALELPVRGQFVVNWVLLAAAGLLLAQLLRSLGIRTGLALASSLLFLLHPISVMTASWLSNRFDLLMVIGLLVALIGAERCYRSGARSSLLLVGAGTLLAATSKELGFMIPLLLWTQARGGFWQRCGSAPWLLAAAIVLPVFAIRQMVIGGGDHVLYPQGILTALTAGVSIWWRQLPNFLYLNGTVLWGMGLCLAVAVLVALYHRRATNGGVAIGVGFAIVTMAMVMQSPTVSLSAITLPDPKQFDGGAYFAARFYYLALIGLLIASAGAVECLWVLIRPESRLPWRHGAILLGTSFVITTSIHWHTHTGALARLWTTESSSIRASLEAAAAATSDAAVSDDCHLYFIGQATQAPVFWAYFDAAVKALVPREEAMRLGSCFIATEHTSWFHTLYGEGHIEPNGMLRPICTFGNILPAQRLGPITFHYLAFPAEGAPLALSPTDHVFLHNARTARFDEITEQVASGAVPVTLHWSRPAENACPIAPL
jgi:hypothetical protein